VEGKRNFIVSTSFLYNKLSDQTQRVRSGFALELLRNAEKLGIQVIVTDGGSEESFLDEVRKFQNIKLVEKGELEKIEGTTMAKQRSLGYYLAYAREGKDNVESFNEFVKILTTDDKSTLSDYVNFSNDDIVMWTEPEKSDLIKQENIEAIMAGFDETINVGDQEISVNIVVPKRSQECMDTLPEWQKFFETKGNKEVNDLIKDQIANHEIPEYTEALGKGYPETDFDFWFGPKAFNSIGVFQYLKTQAEKWDALMEPVITGLSEGWGVVSKVVNYKYDSEEIKNENSEGARVPFILKRCFQYLNIVGTIAKRAVDFHGISGEQITKVEKAVREGETGAKEKMRELSETIMTEVHSEMAETEKMTEGINA
jgi:hypothetical protein